MMMWHTCMLSFRSQLYRKYRLELGFKVKKMKLTLPCYKWHANHRFIAVSFSYTTAKKFFQPKKL